MKKGLLLALCLLLAGFLAVNGTFALPDLNDVFADLTEKLGEFGLPEAGGAGTAVDVALVSPSSTQQLYPGGSAQRTTYVHNQGSGPVYFRLAYAIQYDEETWPLLEQGIEFAPGNGFVQDHWRDISVSGIPYKMMVFTYTGALPAGGNSPDVTLTIAMHESITSQQVARYRSDFLQIQALAIDPTPFTGKGYTTAEAALDLALPLDTLNPF